MRIFFGFIKMWLKLLRFILIPGKNPVAYYAYTPQPLDLESKDYSADPITASFNGGGMLSKRGKLLIDSEGGGGGYLGEAGAHHIAYGGGFGFLNVGYLIKTGWLRVYPLVGIGGGGMGLSLSEKSAIPPGEPLAPPENRVDAGMGGMMLNTGLGLEVKIGGRLALVVGLRIGYMHRLVTFGDQHVPGALGNRPYLRFTIGGGWFSEEQII
jgi:hypothetical protein